jgi:hypothetical protein
MTYSSENYQELTEGVLCLPRPAHREQVRLAAADLIEAGASDREVAGGFG